MVLSEFAEKIKAQFIDADQIEVTETTNFREIGSYDSLTGMSILVMIQDEFDLVIEEDIFKSLNTPKDVFEFIQSKK